MSKQTALQKAIEAIRKAPTDFNHKDDATLTVDDVLNILTDLLQYEREVIEEAYGQGDYDCGKGEFGGTPEFANKTDYFTKTFTENGND